MSEKIESGEEEIARAVRAIHDGFVRHANAIAPAFARFGANLRQIGEAYYRVAEGAYLEEHDRLPGSTRTARLRKKRRDTVLRWFADRLAAVPPRDAGE